jgi:hypothetical protein
MKPLLVGNQIFRYCLGEEHSLLNPNTSLIGPMRDTSAFPNKVYLCIIVRLSRFIYGLQQQLSQQPFMLPLPAPAANCPSNLEQ